MHEVQVPALKPPSICIWAHRLWLYPHPWRGQGTEEPWDTHQEILKDVWEPAEFLCCLMAFQFFLYLSFHCYGDFQWD